MKIKFIVSLIPFFLLVILRMKETFCNSEKVVSFKKWLKETWKNRLINFNLLFLVLILGFFIKNPLIVMTIFVIYCMALALIINHKRYVLSKDKRSNIVFFISLLLYLILLVIMSVIFKEKYLVIYYLILGLLIYINDIFIVLINLCNKKKGKKKVTKGKGSKKRGTTK